MSRPYDEKKEKECYRLTSVFPGREKKECVEDFLPYEIPTQNYPLVPLSGLKKHVDGVCNPPEQLARAFVYQHTRYVSWEEFLDKFHLALEQLVQLIGSSRRWVAFVTDSDGNFAPEKSTFWLFRIAFTYLRKRHPELVSPKRLIRVVTVGTPDPVKAEFRHLYFDDPNPETVVYVKMDDMSYSGEQMASSVDKFAQDNKEKRTDLPITVALVAPFMTRVAFRLISDAIQNANEDRKMQTDQTLTFVVEPFVQEWIPSLDLFLTPKMRANKPFMAALGDTRRPAIYFAHKVPDIVSGYPNIYLGNIPANPDLVSQGCPQRMKPQIIPLITNCEKILVEDAAKKNSQLTNEFSPICPRPPYKPIGKKFGGASPYFSKFSILTTPHNYGRRAATATIMDRARQWIGRRSYRGVPVSAARRYQNSLAARSRTSL